MSSWELAERVAAKVAPHLDGYTVDDKLPHRLNGPNGAELTFTGLSTWQPRVAISGSLPTEYIKRHHYDREHRITVAAWRDGQAIAAEIKRRLIPGYLPALGRAVLVVAADRAADADRRAHAEAIAARFRNASVCNECDETVIRIRLRDSPDALTAHIRLSNQPFGAHINVRFASRRVVDAITDLLSQGDPSCP